MVSESMPEKINLNSKTAYIFAVVFLIVTAVFEVLAYRFGNAFSIVASRIWLAEGLLLFAALIGLSMLTLIEDIKSKKIALIICTALLLAFLAGCIGNIYISDINPDSCTQIADGLNSFKQLDWNYTGKGFLGYQNRQYLIAAIPSLIFGRNVFSLHLGFGAPFLAGVLLLIIELRKWCAEHFKTNELFAVLPAGSLLIFPFITEYYRNFEQAFTPVTLTLIAVSLYMRLIRKPDVVTVIALSWIGAFLADSYTPGLATWALVICFVILNMTPYWKKVVPVNIENKVYFLVLQISSVVNMAVFFVASVVFGRGDRLTSIGDNVTINVVLKDSIEEFINDRNVRFLGFFAGAFILYLFFSFLGQLKLYDFVLSGWMLGVVFISTYLKGFTDYGKEHLAQRFMIIIPVFIVACFLVIMRIVSKNKIEVKKSTLAILFVFSLLCGVYNLGQQHYSFKYFGSVVPMKYLLPEIGKTLKANGKSCEDRFNIVVYTDSGLKTNMHDYAKYFYPNATCNSFLIEDNVPVPVPDNQGITLIVSEKEFPEGVLKDTDTFESISKKDPIYDLDITWYLITRYS